jgi:serine protease inhibitor
MKRKYDESLSSSSSSSSPYFFSSAVNYKTELSFFVAKNLFLKKNIVFSPFSLEMIFGIISAGTSGDTQLELLRFLGLRSMKDLGDLVKIRSDLLKHFSPDHSALHLDGPVFSFANGLWVPKSLPLKSSFKDILTTMFNAPVSDLHTYNRVCSQLLFIWFCGTKL